MTMEERLTVCNMSIEGGARFGYINPDQTTFDYLRGRPYAPAGRRLRPRGDVVAEHRDRARRARSTTSRGSTARRSSRS